MKQNLSIKYVLPRLKPSKSLLAVLCALIVSACSTYDDLSMDTFNVFKEPDPVYCPTISILGNAERITIFKEGPGRDIIDITTEALMDDFQASCVNQMSEATSVEQVMIDLAVGYTASRGPANKDGTFTIPYFVSILDKDKNVLNKVNFQIKSVFDGNRYRVSGYDEIVSMVIPVSPPLTGNDFMIYIGFQLTPEQLNYNQHSG